MYEDHRYVWAQIDSGLHWSFLFFLYGSPVILGVITTLPSSLTIFSFHRKMLQFVFLLLKIIIIILSLELFVENFTVDDLSAPHEGNSIISADVSLLDAWSHKTQPRSGVMLWSFTKCCFLSICLSSCNPWEEVRDFGCRFRATLHTRLRARDHSISSTLIGG